MRGLDNDGDGFGSDSRDNCHPFYNPDQNDSDGDGLGDKCEDFDEDGVNNIYETTWTELDDGPFDPNPDQANGDGDPTGDACDDSEGDTFFDSTDNCDTNSNPDQTDTDADGQGNPCDHDDDNDSVNDDLDNCPTTWSPNQTDSDGDEIGDACDSWPNGEDIPPGPDTDHKYSTRYTMRWRSARILYRWQRSSGRTIIFRASFRLRNFDLH